MRSRPLALVAPLLAMCAGAQAADVRVVAPSGAPYTTLQAAITAAADGDVVLVKSGDYAGATIDGKGLVVVEDEGETVRLTSALVVQNVSAGQCVVLAGLEVAAANAPALEARSIAGALRVESCVLRVSPSFAVSSVPACELVDVADAVLAATHCTGGTTQNGILQGGAAVRATRGKLALYDCVLQGAPGVYQAGRGGFGLALVDGELFASNCDLRGGIGGPGGVQFTGGPGCLAQFPLPGGPGGDAVSLATAWPVRMLDCRPAGGAGGAGGVTACGSQAASGAAGGAALGSTTIVPGVARTFSAAVVAREGQAHVLRVRGIPDERAWVFLAANGGHAFHAALAGVAAIQNPFLMRIPLGVIPSSGELVASLAVPELGPQVAASVRHAQVVCTSPAGLALAGPRVLVRLDAAR